MLQPGSWIDGMEEPERCVRTVEEEANGEKHLTRDAVEQMQRDGEVLHALRSDVAMLRVAVAGAAAAGFVSLAKREGLDQLDHYKRLLLDLGKPDPREVLVRAVFTDAQTRLRKPTKVDVRERRDSCNQVLSWLFPRCEAEAALPLMGRDAPLKGGENVHRQEPPRERSGLVPGNRSQIVAGPDEVVEFAGHNPRRRIVQPEPPLDGGR
jgi:hypothetical protein